QNLILSSVSIASPPQPPSVTLASVSTTTATLSWSAVSGATGYNVVDGSGTVIASTTNLSYQITGLQPNTSYRYGVQSVGASGTSAASYVSFTTAAPPPPPPPQGLTASAGWNSVSLSWQPVSGATSYVVSRNGQQIATVTSTSYVDTPVSPDTGYSYAVSAVGPGGTSPPATCYALTADIPTTPAPTQVHSQGPLYGTGSISWTPGPGTPSGTVYYVYQSGKLLGTTTSTSYTLPNYNPRWPYTVSAQAPGWQMSAQVSDSPLGGMGWAFSPVDLLSNSVALVASVSGILLLVLTVAFTPRLVQYTRRLVGEHRQRDRAVDVAREIDAEWYAVDVPAPQVRDVSAYPSAPVAAMDVVTPAVSSTLPLRTLSGSVSVDSVSDDVSVDLAPIRAPRASQTASEGGEYQFTTSDSRDYRYEYDFES
ncbi:MAG: fibronectin type III domain-containing protein, partial [Thermaceae bacterium]|nr:fibronectin type III domain-containing protein [Thermaceae bacterium]